MGRKCVLNQSSKLSISIQPLFVTVIRDPGGAPISQSDHVFLALNMKYGGIISPAALPQNTVV